MPEVRVEIALEVLESVLEECDRYDHEETRGRIIGHFAMDRETLVIRAGGVIGPGPNARRTSTSLLQDRDFQAEVFRRIEAEDPSVEHLGSWHTHRVNGCLTLSAGDRETYCRTVNHELHNPDFFYALLVTLREEGRSGLDRYAVRHCVLFRGDGAVHEIDRADVEVTRQPRIRPWDHRSWANAGGGDGVAVRVRDQVVLGVMFPSLEPRMSVPSRTLFWKGQLPLIDESAIDVKVAEEQDEGTLLYQPVVSPASEHVEALCRKGFPSASHAARAFELRMNAEIYEAGLEER